MDVVGGRLVTPIVHVAMEKLVEHQSFRIFCTVNVKD
jgi:hypothetical protein